MKFGLVNDNPVLFYAGEGGTEKYASLNPSILNLEDKEQLLELIILYCEGKRPSSIPSWIGRLNKTIFYTIEYLCIKKLPQKTQAWREFIRQAYVDTLTGAATNSSLTTRVNLWNKNIKPLLLFMQFRDAIPLDVIIPRMKKVGEQNTNTSFKVKLLGSFSPKKDDFSENLDKILTPISLHRTDSEYLDEIKFDLERKRERLLGCLLKYWETVRSHYYFGQSLIESFPQTHPELLKRYEDNDIYIITHDRSKRSASNKYHPPRRVHIADPDTEDGFKLYMYLIYKKMNSLWSRTKLKDISFPWKELSECKNSYFPKVQFEQQRGVKTIARCDWSMGVFSNQDISYFIALLMLLNPKFTFESLVFSKISSVEGKPFLELSDLGCTFSIEKARANTMKKEVLDEVSLDILTVVLEANETHQFLIQKEHKNFLFVSPNMQRNVLTLTTKARVSSFLTGYNSQKKANNKEFSACLSDYFPSLLDVDLRPGTITHSKIRHTEGVLEWFRTGSSKLASKKLGNSNRVTLEHYIPKPLLAAYNTRFVRRFQNLLILAATYGEDYCLEAVDFNSLSEINIFLKSLLTDDNNKSPLITYLRDLTQDNSVKKPEGCLHVPLSESTLTAIYLYRLAAINSNVNTEILSQVDTSIDISPLAFIDLANHLISRLPNEKESRLIRIHNQSMKRSQELIGRTSWDKMFMKRGNVM